MKNWDASTKMWAVIVGSVAIATVLAYMGIGLAYLVNGTGVYGANPVSVAVRVWAGEGDGLPRFWALVCLAVVVVGIVSVLVWRAWRKWKRGVRGGKKRGDRVAKKAASRKEIAVLGIKDVQASADRLGVVGGPGLPVGRMVAGDVPLYSNWEFVSVMIAGPRTGKTTAWLVPRIYAAPGAVVATSNKRDLVDITRQDREQVGRAWVFDPQGIADEAQTWWWNILETVTSPVEAVSLAEVFIDSQRDPNAQKNAFFDGASKDLLAVLLLAAAAGNHDIRIVHEWLARSFDDEPVRILERAGYSLSAVTLRATVDLPAETRGGVYGGASQTMSFILNDAATRWVLPTKGAEQFHPAAFVRSTDTLYCLSQEGRGSAAPIVTALTVAVIEAALTYAKTWCSGRLDQPMFVALDEAANVCRWRELPDLYSHFGSRGIVVDTLLQSWSQGVSVWGEAGMNKLWSSANVKAYGGGVSEERFLQSLSSLIGVEYVDAIQTTTSSTGASRSVSHKSSQRPIAAVSDLMSLPANRAWVFASGAPAVYVRTVPYWQTTR